MVLPTDKLPALAFWLSTLSVQISVVAGVSAGGTAFAGGASEYARLAALGAGLRYRYREEPHTELRTAAELFAAAADAFTADPTAEKFAAVGDAFRHLSPTNARIFEA